MLKMDDNSSHEDIKVSLFVDKENSKTAMVTNTGRQACDLMDSKMSTTEIIGQLNELNCLQQQCPLGSDNIEDRINVNIKIEPCSDYMQSIANGTAPSDSDAASEALGARHGNIGIKDECITEKIIFDLQAVKTEPLEVMAHSITHTEAMFDIVGQGPELSIVTACKDNIGNIDAQRSSSTYKEVNVSNCHLKPMISDNIVSKDTDCELVSAPEQICIRSDSNTSELTVQQVEVESVDSPSSNIHLQDSVVEHPYIVTGCDKVKVMQTNEKEDAAALRETCKSNGFVEGMSAVAGCSNLDDVIIIDQPESSNLMDYRSSDNVIVVHDSSDSSVDDSDDEEKDSEEPSKSTETSINKIISNEREDFLEQERNIKLNRYGFEDIRTKGELLPEELPPLEELTITVDESVYMEEVGHVKSIVGILVVIQSSASVPPLDDDTILFVEGHKVLGQVFEVFGPVKTPWYSVRFNQEDNIVAKGIHVGMKIYCALRENSFTKFVFMDSLKTVVGSDASWEDNNEPPEKHLDYSDDEAERMAKAKKKHKRSRENGTGGTEDVPKKYRHNQKVDRAQQSPRPGYQMQQQPHLQSVAIKCGFNPFQRTSHNNTNMAGAGHHLGNGNTGTSRYIYEDNCGQNGEDFNTPASRFGGPPNFQNRHCFGSGFKQNTEPKQLQTSTGQAFGQTNTGQAFSQTNTGQAFCQTNTGQAFSTQSQSNQSWLFGNVSHTSMLREQAQPVPMVNSQYPQGPFCHKSLPDFTKPPPNFQSHPPNFQNHPPNFQNHPPNLQKHPPNLQSHGVFNESRAPIAQRNVNTPGCNQSLNTALFQDWGRNVTFPTLAHHQVSAGDVQSGTRSLSAESTANIQSTGNGRYQVATSSRKKIPIHYLNTRSSTDQPDKRTPGQFEEISVGEPRQSSYRQLEAQNTHSFNNSSSVNDRDMLYTTPAAIRFENTNQWASKPNVFNPSRYIHNNRDTY